MAFKYPWFKFNPTHWRADQMLRICSIGARGLWIEMLCVMHEAEPYGHLVVNGVPVTDTQLAMLTGVSQDQATNYLAELESAGVFSRNAKSVIYSRRMTRDLKMAQNAQRNGKNGGNPSLSKTKDNSASDNPTLNLEDKAVVKLKTSESRDKKSPSKPPKGGRKRARPEEYSHKFKDFMAVYPSRGEALNPWPRAWKAWLSAIERGGVADEIIAAAGRYAKTEAAGTKFTAMAATWLNDDCWREAVTGTATAETKIEPPPDLKGWRLAAWKELGAPAYRSWIEPAFVTRAGTTVTIRVKTKFTADWMRNHYGGLLLRLMTPEGVEQIQIEETKKEAA